MMDQGPSHPVRRNPCCGHLVNVHHTLDEIAAGVGPGVKELRGSYSVCIQCGALLVYTDDYGSSRRAEFEDWVALSGRLRAQVRKARRIILARVRKEGGRGGTGVDFGT